MVQNCFHFLIPICDSEKYEIIPKWILLSHHVKDKKGIIPNEFINSNGSTFPDKFATIFKRLVFLSEDTF